MGPMRISCCVPHCRRTKQNAEGYAEWICAKHWSAVPRDKRRVWQRVRRDHRKGIPQFKRRVDRLWQRLKRIAIEKGMGL